MPDDGFKTMLKTYGLKLFRKVFGKDQGSLPPPQYRGQAASDLIYKQLETDSPCMIARFGNVELTCVINYINMKSNDPVNYFKYLRGDRIFLEWTDNTRKKMQNNAGFFPADDEHLVKFSRLMLNCIPEVDILGSWVRDEIFVQDILRAKTVHLLDLEPYYHSNAWSRILKGKTVLVIHPFIESIKQQYLRRNTLFSDNDVLPEFNLETIKAVQSMGGNTCGYKTWFDALDTMKDRIMQKKYDIAIIGCGAYGFPLAAFVKEQGKKAVHLGGATQMLFGIKGTRWDNTGLYNEYWIRPNKNETPSNYKDVEDGCYW